MLDTIFGLPIHPLIVHATVVMVPLAALAVLLAGLWPRFRRWAGWLPLGLALVAAVLTPLSTQSGEALQRRVGRTDLVRQHVQMADGLLPWVAGLVVAAALTTAVWRRSRQAPASADGAERRVAPGRPGGEGVATSRSMILVAAALAVVASAGTTVQVVRIGHSGAEAAWSSVSGPRAARPAAVGAGH